MKVRLLKSDLVSKVTVAQRFVSTRSTLPILSHIKLVAKGSKLMLMATNLEMSFVTSVGAQIEIEGELCIPAKTFTDLISVTVDEHINLSSDQEILTIETESAKTTIAGSNTSDFPEIPETIDMQFSINTKLLSNSLSHVIFSASADDSRPVLAGVLMIMGEKISLVSSDGFRLSQFDMDTKAPHQMRLILPKACVTELTKLVKDASDTVDFSFDEANNQLIIKVGDMIIATRIIDGEYPPFEKIIPQSSRVQVVVPKAELLSALKQIAVIAREGANLVELSVSDTSVTLTTENPQSGTSRVQVSAQVDGGALSIVYNFKYILDVLAVIDGNNVTMKFNDSASAGVFVTESDPHFLHLIMPVKS